MSPSQKDDDGQEWEKKPRALDFDTMYWEISNGLRPIAECEEEEDADRILADHRDAQQLRERVRVLEEALRKIEGAMYYNPPMTGGQILDLCIAVLKSSSPAAATEDSKE